MLKKSDEPQDRILKKNTTNILQYKAKGPENVEPFELEE
jgi:hypothetical protein